MSGLGSRVIGFYGLAFHEDFLGWLLWVKSEQLVKRCWGLGVPGCEVEGLGSLQFWGS